MRRILLASTTCALLALARPAHAQSSGSWIGSLGGGVTLPVGDAGDVMKTGWHGYASLGWHPNDSKIDWLVDATYHHLDSKLINAEGANNIFVALGRVNYWAGAKLYLIGGAGLMRNEIKIDFNGTPVNSTHSAFAMTGGVGFLLGKQFFVEGRLLNGFTDGSSTTLIPVTLGIRF